MNPNDYFKLIDETYAKYDSAEVEKVIKQTIEMSGDEFGTDSSIYVALLSELGGFYRSEGRYLESEDYFKRALSVLEMCGNGDSANYATVLNNLAGTYRRMRAYDKAETTFAQCLSMYKRHIGETNEVYASGLNNLGLVQIDLKNYTKALEYFNQANSILDQLPNGQYEKATTLSNMASLYYQDGKYQAAVTHVNQALDIFKKLNVTKSEHYDAAKNLYEILNDKIKNIKGIELARAYFYEIALPVFKEKCQELLECASFGLAGEGSECFGFDDDISKDHNWGPGFCIWLGEDDYNKYGELASKLYDALPKEYLGYRRINQTEMTLGRVGVIKSEDFFNKFLGTNSKPDSILSWRLLPESGIATAVNGEVWIDNNKEFSSLRSALKEFYPEDIKKKKLAMNLALAAQAGPYNYYRCIQRGEKAAAFLAASEFISHIQQAVFLMNNQYWPYYKWTNKAMHMLSIVGADVAEIIDNMVSKDDMSKDIELICSKVIEALKSLGYTKCNSDFLLHHAEEIQLSIDNEDLRELHIIAC